MSSGVGQIDLDLKINGKDYKKQVKQYGNYGSKQLQASFSGAFKGIGKMAAGAFAIAGIAKFTSSCLSLGSALTEVENITAVAFPGMSAQMDDFAKNAATNFGLSETMAKRFTGMYGTMAKQFGFANQEAFKMGSTLAGLAGDAASFYDMSQDEAYTKLKAVFSGETEVLKDIGVVMTQSALDQYALANSYGKTTAKMTEQEKVALRFAFIQDQLAAASGDFLRTQDSWANQTRVLSLRFDQLKASLGKGFIAVFTPIVKGINWVLANLQPLADSFASFFEMLTGYSGDTGSGALAGTAGEIAGATEGAGGLSDGLADAGKSGEKAAKKIEKAFSKVDTINKLTFGSDEGSDSGSGSGDGGAGGSVANAVDFVKPSKDANVFKGMLDVIINEFKRLADLFKFGFEIGFGDSFKNILRLKDYIGSIGDSLKNIFLASEVTSLAKEWVDNLILALGKVTGSIASIGVTIGTLFVGSIATYLKDNTNFIKSAILDWFMITGKTAAITGNFAVVLADIVSVFSSDTAVSIGSNFISAIANGFIGQYKLLARIGLDILDCIVGPIMENAELIKTTISGMLAPIESITSTIAKGITDTFMKVDEVYKKYMSPTFANIKKGLSNVFESILDTYNEYLKPVIDMIAKNFGELWQNSIQPAINSMIQFFGKLSEMISVLWVNALAPLIEWMLGVFGPIIATVFENTWNVIQVIVTFISDVIKGLSETLGGLCEFLSGVFTLDWEKAWAGIQSVFSGVIDIIQSILGGAMDFVSTIIENTLNSISGVWEGAWNGIGDFFSFIWSGITSGVTTAINFVSDTIGNVVNGIKGTWENAWNGIKNFVQDTWNFICGIFSFGGKFFDGVVGSIGDIFKSIVNTILEGINKIISIPLGVVSDALKTIHDIDLPIIGKPFTVVPRGFDIPQLPMLAQGGYVKANQPQLAMIGDNKRYGEIVAPENKMLDMVNTALAMQKENASIGGMDALIALMKQLIDLVKNLSLKVDFDMKKMSVLLENAKKERQMMGG